jgi:hypothetical protein
MFDGSALSPAEGPTHSPPLARLRRNVASTLGTAPDTLKNDKPNRGSGRSSTETQAAVPGSSGLRPEERSVVEWLSRSGLEDVSRAVVSVVGLWVVDSLTCGSPENFPARGMPLRRNSS